MSSSSTARANDSVTPNDFLGALIILAGFVILLLAWARRSPLLVGVGRNTTLFRVLYSMLALVFFFGGLRAIVDF
jgi:hypothetical protein